MNEIIFTVVMPTYNAEKNIEKALKSIRRQDFPQEKIEILVVDGGSSDNTLSIARKYKAKVIDNPDRICEVAKKIGLSSAKGKYVIMQDSDEVLTSKKQYKKRYEYLEKHQEVYCLLPDKSIPGKGCGLCCPYVNYVADPFGYIIYRISGSHMNTNKKNKIRTDKDGNTYYFGKNDIVPIGDAGTTTIDLQKAKELFGNEKVNSQEFATSMFILMVNKTNYVGIIPGDNYVHYSAGTLKTYLRKLRFRVYINLNKPEQSGFSSRAMDNSVLRNRKVLFVLYGMSVILPFIDSFRLAFKYKSISMLLHFFYTYYVCVTAVIAVSKKILHIKSDYYTYG